MKFIILFSIYMALNYLVCWFFLEWSDSFLAIADRKTNNFNELLKQIPKEIRVWELILLLLFPLFLIILLLLIMGTCIVNFIYVLGETIAGAKARLKYKVGAKARLRYKKAINKVINILNKQPFSGKKTTKKTIDK